MTRRPVPAAVCPWHPDELHNPLWEIKLGGGPVIAVALHDGHRIRDSLRPMLAVDGATRRREEDPLTGLLATAGDTQVRVRASRFQMDLNRPRERAFARDPAQTWGLVVWRSDPPATEIERSLDDHARFYALVEALVERTIEDHGVALVLDIHSYNHRRDGAEGPAADPSGNPEIDLGYTEFDRGRHGRFAAAFAEALAVTPIEGRTVDIRENVRYEGGGHFPEWMFRRFGPDACAITLEYKKFYMDEWTGHADLAVVEDLRRGLEHAIAATRSLLTCR